MTTGRPRRRAAAAMGGLSASAAALYFGPGLAILPPARRALEPWLVWRGPSSSPAVALTFDDGPDPRYAERYLDALGGTPATFFVLGEAARRRPDLVAHQVRRGHEVACHGDTHEALPRLGPAATVSALRRARDSIADAAGSPPRFYRPAFGWFTAPAWAAAPRLGMRRALWTSWAADWQGTATAERTADRILTSVGPGSILLLHDARGAENAPERTLAALPAILEGLEARGLRPVTLSMLLGAGGGPAAGGA